ncbi:MAG: radical SAM protein [Nanoarchaeota archaeon]
MGKRSFRNIRFAAKGNDLEVIFLRIFRTSIPLDKLGKAEVKGNDLVLDASAERRFDGLLADAFSRLSSLVTGKPVTYVHRNSGIPLFGNNSFGIVDRGSSLVEVKPMTGCNLNCVYCSVNQDARDHDFVVEAEYIVEEFAKLAAFKDCPLEAHIGTQGEPLLYADLLTLVSGLARIPQVKGVSMDTSGVMLTRELADSLVAAGMTQFNISLNATDPELAERMAGRPYPTKKVMEMCRHLAAKADVTLAPVLVQGMNESEMPKLIAFAKDIRGSHKVRVGVQNFLTYRFGRNPAKELTWEKFYAFLRKLEEEYGEKLILTAGDFSIKPAKQLPKPFGKGDIVKAEIACPGRLPGEMVAVAKGRCVSVMNASRKVGEKVDVKILSAKHNLFLGKVLKGVSR